MGVLYIDDSDVLSRAEDGACIPPNVVDGIITGLTIDGVLENIVG